MSKLYFSLLLSFILIISCKSDPGVTHKREAFVIDSINMVHKQAILRRDSIHSVKLASISNTGINSDDMRIHLERIEVGKSIKRRALEKVKKSLDLKIENGDKRLEGIRNNNKLSLKKRNEEINLQQKEVIKLQQGRTALETEISYSNLFNSFDFQSSPEGTVQHFFDITKSKDYSNLRHLTDPYGEWKDSALELSYLGLLSSEGKEIYDEFFSEGRIVGSPVINENIAEIEIAYGLGSVKLMKIKLIKRMDKWYVLSM